jgi:MFS family permease
VVTKARDPAARRRRAPRPPLPREVYILQAGLVINAFGNGAANPFTVLYLHAVRGIPLALAGLAGSTGAVCAIVAGMVAGGLADRRGPRATMLTGLFVSTAGWSLYPLVRQPWHAIALAVLTGSGIGAWLTMQSTMLALITPADLRHAAFAQQRVAANLGLGLGGLTGGLIVAAATPASFTVLFGLNAATFLVYGAFLVRLRLPDRAPRGGPRGYGGVLRDGVFRRLLVLNLAFVTVSVALVNSMFPVFAVTVAGVGAGTVGMLFLLNSLLIVGAQMPVARAIEGHRRARGLFGMCVLVAVTWLLVEAAGLLRVPPARAGAPNPAPATELSSA